MKARIATLLVVVLSLVACGPPNRLTSGTVVDMHYDDRDETYYPGHWQDGGESCSGGYNNQPRICTQNPDYYIPGYTDVDPPHWSIQVTGVVDDKHLKEWHTVSEHDYNCIRIGKYWVTGKDPCIPG